MRLAINSPAVVSLPGSPNTWEQEAGIAELTSVAQEADRLGYHHLTCSEHVMIPSDAARQRGGTYWDPLATFGHLAAHTERIRLATHVLVLGYHHPLEIAKRYGTLDMVSGGRLVLGLGVGSLKEEFDMLGAPFEGRGERADDALRALRAALGDETPRYHGEHYSFSDVVVRPAAVQDHVPFWIGGNTRRSLRRATTLGDGWAPFGLPLEELSRMLGQAELPSDFDVVLGSRTLDPEGERDGTLKALAGLSRAGATIATVKLAARSCEHYLDQMRLLQQLHAEELCA